jgi:hypothetical protein
MIERTDKEVLELAVKHFKDCDEVLPAFYGALIRFAELVFFVEGWPEKMERPIDPTFPGYEFGEVDGYNSALDAAHLVYVRDMAEKDKEIAELKREKEVLIEQNDMWKKSWEESNANLRFLENIIVQYPPVEFYAVEKGSSVQTPSSVSLANILKELSTLKSQVYKVSAEELTIFIRRWIHDSEWDDMPEEFYKGLATAIADKFNGGKQC